MLGPLQAEGAVERIVRRIGEAIGAGLLEPGERLPAEADLAAQLDVAPMTLRQALAILRDAGFIETQRGRSGGSFVRPDAPGRSSRRRTPSRRARLPYATSPTGGVPFRARPPRSLRTALGSARRSQARQRSRPPSRRGSTTGRATVSPTRVYTSRSRRSLARRVSSSPRPSSRGRSPSCSRSRRGRREREGFAGRACARARGDRGRRRGWRPGGDGRARRGDPRLDRGAASRPSPPLTTRSDSRRRRDLVRCLTTGGLFAPGRVVAGTRPRERLRRLPYGVTGETFGDGALDLRRTSGPPLRVAVVGSGPAGFYATGAPRAPALPVEVDMFERLPTPWGLVRLGSRPTIPKIKSVSRAFERIAQRPGFRFFGNVEVGRDLAHDELSGSTTPSSTRSARRPTGAWGFRARTCRARGPRRRSSPGTTATPTSRRSPFDLSAERAVVVGNGNVAVDVARMLALTAGRARADRHDGRGDRGDRRLRHPGDPRAGAPRARRRRRSRRPSSIELTELAGADLVVDRRPSSSSTRRARLRSRRTRRSHGGISRCCARWPGRRPPGKPVTVRLRFCVSPVAILGECGVEAVEVVRNELVADPSGRIRAVPTDEREVIPCGIVLRSVGYRGTALPGVPFDEARATMPNDGGRVLGDDGAPLPGVYCTGWIKRGPSGVIGTNKKDATETVELLLADAAAGRSHTRPRGRASRSSFSVVGPPRSPMPAGRRSTRSSARVGRRKAGPASSSATGTSCSRPRRRASSVLPQRFVCSIGRGRRGSGRRS